MRPSRRITVVLSAVLAVCLGAAVFTVTRADQARPAATLEDVLYLQSPSLLKRMSLGYTGLLADIYWTRAVQYFGSRHVVRSRDYRLLAPLLQITTHLDPHLTAAYEFGSTFLTQPPPDGAGDPDAAINLVRYGIQHNPGEWRLYYDLGFIYYLDKRDYLDAARAFEQGSKVPNAHPFLKILAARMAEQGGDVETARLLWTTTYESTENQEIKANAISHLQSLEVDEVVPKLEGVVREYTQRTGHAPQNWMELIQAGYLRGVPMDPLGHAYKLAGGGRVEVADADKLPFITRGLPPERQASEKPNR
jgi:tetratricopeptide (TPR) repeat protein